MSKESMEITINTSKWYGRAKQWNGNSHISCHKLACSHFIVILFTTQCQLYFQELSHPFSSLLWLYINYCIFHASSLQPCTAMYTSRSLLESIHLCTYVHLHSCISHDWRRSNLIHYWIRFMQFHTKLILLLTNNSTWCQNRGCICISSTRRTYGRIQSCIQVQ